jgi:peptide/nickel transport system substrate-binding protein
VAKPAAGQPRRGGTLRLGVPTDLGSLDGHVRSGGSVDSIYQVYDRLVEYDEAFTPQPMLAESWDVSADFTRIKFNLRQGVQYHNGREFTSDDVKWNLLRVRDPKIAGGNWVAQSNWFTSIETPDKATLILSSDNPRPALFEFFENFNMLDKDTMEGPNAKDHAIGTGPFALTEWVTGDHLAFSRNASYWQSGKPYVDGFVANVRPAQTALTQLEAGALDMVKSPPVADIIRLQSDATYTNIAHPFAGSFLEFGINVTKPPFDNKKVRQALNYAINRKRFAEQIYRGTSVIQSLPWGPSSPAYDAAKNGTYAFDLDKAKALLAEAGVSNLDMEAWVNANFNPQVDTFLQVYQADLATLGIRMTIKAVAAAEWGDTVNNRRYVGIYASPDSSAQLSPSNLLNAGNAWRPEPANNSGFKDDTWTRLIAAANIEVDSAKQRQLYAQINDFILDQSFVMPYSNQPVTFEARTNVHGMKPTLHGGGWVYTDLWLDA